MVINDVGIVESAIDVTGLNAPLSYYTTVTAQIWFPHSNNVDLAIYLYGADGSYMTLSYHKGLTFSNVFDGTLFTDSAPNSVSNYPFSKNGVVSPLKPEDRLTYFGGRNPNGQWKIWASDYIPIIGSGRLNAFILNIQGLYSFSFFLFF